jgi:hypothetical protein
VAYLGWLSRGAPQGRIFTTISREQETRRRSKGIRKLVAKAYERCDDNTVSHYLKIDPLPVPYLQAGF